MAIPKAAKDRVKRATKKPTYMLDHIIDSDSDFEESKTSKVTQTKKSTKKTKENEDKNRKGTSDRSYFMQPHKKAVTVENICLHEEVRMFDFNLVEELLSLKVATLGVSWDDIIGNDNAKQAIEESLMWPRLNPSLFQGINRPIKGLLLYGPPGNGKTMLAKAIASQIKATFFSVTPSRLNSKWSGEAATRVDILFTIAKLLSPTILFFDEVDSLTTERKEGEGGNNRQLKTQLLSCIDGMEETTDIFIIGATNCPWDMDSAFLRRFERKVLISLPTKDALRKIFSSHLHLEEHIDLILDNIDCFSAADAFTLCRQLFNARLRKSGSGIKDMTMEDLSKICLTKPEVLDYMKKVKKSTSNELLKRYDTWSKTF